MVLNAVQESERRFRYMVNQAPVGIIILKGKDFVTEIVNETYLQVVGRKESEMIGRSLAVTKYVRFGERALSLAPHSPLPRSVRAR